MASKQPYVLHLMTAADYRLIRHDLKTKKFFWSSSPGADMHYPNLLKTSCAQSSFVLKVGNQIVSYIIAEIRNPTRKNGHKVRTGYVRLIATRKDRKDWTRKGYASRVYAAFEGYARAKNCRRLEAVTSTANKNSIAFHNAIGMTGTLFSTEKGKRVNRWRLHKTLR